MGVRQDLSDRQESSWLEASPDLFESGNLVWDLPKDSDEHRTVEEGCRQAAGAQWGDQIVDVGQPGLFRSGAGPGNHPGLDINCEHTSTRRNGGGNTRGEEPLTAPGVEDMKPGGESETRQHPGMVAGRKRILKKAGKRGRTRQRR